MLLCQTSVGPSSICNTLELIRVHSYTPERTNEAVNLSTVQPVYKYNSEYQSIASQRSSHQTSLTLGDAGITTCVTCTVVTVTKLTGLTSNG